MVREGGIGVTGMKTNVLIQQENLMDEFPSLSKRHPRPCGWIQWKGTDVCCDIHCKCGAFLHYDGGFMYHIKCSECGRVYECDGHIKLYELSFEPENTIVLEDE
jgi:hypothetical protein